IHGRSLKPETLLKGPRVVLSHIVSPRQPSCLRSINAHEIEVGPDQFRARLAHDEGYTRVMIYKHLMLINSHLCGITIDGTPGRRFPGTLQALCEFVSGCIFAVNNSKNSGWSFDARRTSARPVAAQM